jgi:hypothetical protein
MAPIVPVIGPFTPPITTTLSWERTSRGELVYRLRKVQR